MSGKHLAHFPAQSRPLGRVTSCSGSGVSGRAHRLSTAVGRGASGSRWSGQRSPRGQRWRKSGRPRIPGSHRWPRVTMAHISWCLSFSKHGKGHRVVPGSRMRMWEGSSEASPGSERTPPPSTQHAACLPLPRLCSFCFLGPSCSNPPILGGPKPLVGHCLSALASRGQ